MPVCAPSGRWRAGGEQAEAEVGIVGESEDRRPKEKGRLIFYGSAFFHQPAEAGFFKVPDKIREADLPRRHRGTEKTKKNKPQRSQRTQRSRQKKEKEERFSA